ncbi:helix-turn-helix domain-containing protein [Lacrimispora aerotolerans]|uniref:helix-turn-helix domain-containing protein n=1 Tax=Lacrimispora aerotolerans TaxID=36832 RepID=UPI0005545190|nr:helix-turn-helix transcriptional regulator [Lacrimispora aerotolerans]
MNDNQEIGRNLRVLRKIHHETQEGLGELLGLSKSAISAYEKGERALDTQKLQLYANHYCKTVDELVNGDLTGLKSMRYFHGSKEQMKKMFNYLFPRVYSDEASHNKNFQSAYEKHTKIYEAMYGMETPSKVLVSRCWEEYSGALEESELVEAAVNILGLLFICWTSIADKKNIEIGNMIKTSGTIPLEIKNLLADGDTVIDPEIERLREQFLEEYDDMAMELIAYAKASMEWAECGDFYLAMKYIVGMQDNYLSLEMNQQIGIQMICSLCELNNPYALRYLLEQDEIIE